MIEVREEVSFEVFEAKNSRLNSMPRQNDDYPSLKSG